MTLALALYWTDALVVFAACCFFGGGGLALYALLTSGSVPPRGDEPWEGAWEERERELRGVPR